MPTFITTLKIEVEVTVLYSASKSYPATRTSPEEPSEIKIHNVTCGNVRVPQILWEDQVEALEDLAFEDMSSAPAPVSPDR